MVVISIVKALKQPNYREHRGWALKIISDAAHNSSAGISCESVHRENSQHRLLVSID